MVIQGTIRRARGLSKERNGGGGWEATNAGPECGLRAVAAGSHGQYGGQRVLRQKVGKDGHSGHTVESHPGDYCRDTGG